MSTFLAAILARLARFVVRQSPATWLFVCGFGSLLIYHFAFGACYPMSRFGARAMQSLATLNGMSADGAFIYIVAFAGLFGLYWLGYQSCARRPVVGRPWLYLVTFALLSNVVLLPMYPLDAADVYDYIIRGRMSSVYGMNPLQAVPRDIQGDPFYRFAAWRDVPSAYGPLWEMLSALTSKLAGDDATANVVAYKLVSVIGYLAAALFIYLTLRQLAPRRAFLGAYLFLWNPLVIYMAGGTGHNDTLMAACIVLSILCLARRWYVAAVLAAILGALIKFIPLFLLPIIAIVALRDLKVMRRRVRFVFLSGLLGLLLAALTYGPFWFGLETLRAERRSEMYTGSWATLIRQTLAPTLDGKGGETWVISTPNTNALLSDSTLVLFGLAYLWGLWRVFRGPDFLTPARVSAWILTSYLLVACLWFQSWYVVWVLALVALLDDAPLRRLILLFSYLVTWQPLLYNYVTLRPGNLAPLPWRDLIPVAVIMGGSYLYIGWYWLSTWLRTANRTPLTVEVGRELRTARQAAKLSPADLADELAIPTDVLLAYERGDRAVPLDRLERICVRLGLSRLDTLTLRSDSAPSAQTAPTASGTGREGLPHPVGD